MSFLSPFFLLALLGVGLPIAIHLIRREKAPTVVFSTVRFLKKIPKKNIFFQKIQQWMLLLIRVAIVALLALAFARPFMTGALPRLAGWSPQSVVILLDTSMSMRYGDTFDRAKMAATETIGSLRAGDEAALVSFSDGIRRVRPLTSDREALLIFVGNIDVPDYRTTRYIPALRLAGQLLASARHPDQRVVLISDFQRRAFTGLDPSWRLPPGVKFEGIRAGDLEKANLTVTHARVRTPQRDQHLVVGQVQNTGEQPVGNARVSLRIGEKILGQKTVALSPPSEGRVEFRTSIRQQNLHLADITVEDDAFAPDNTFYFIIDASPPIKVLCIRPDEPQDGSLWLRLALEGETPSPFQTVSVHPLELATDALAIYGAVVLLNVGSLEVAQIDAVKSYVAQGGSLLLAPADRVDAAAFNRLFEALTPARLERKRVALQEDFATLSAMGARHPIVRPLKEGGRIDFGAARFSGYWSATPLGGSEVILRFDNGEPALLERSVGQGRVLLFTSSLDTTWTDLPTKMLYLPLMQEVFRYLSRGGSKNRSYSIGDGVQLPRARDTVVYVTDPLGRTHAIESSAAGTSIFADTHVPGFYRVRAGKTAGYFAVNVPAEESDFTFVSPMEIQDAVRGPDVQPRVSTGNQTAGRNTQMEKSQQLWWWLLLAVLILGLYETHLANRTYR